MDPTNTEIYNLVLHDAPYVIAGYGVLWAALVVYVGMVLRRIMRLEKEVLILGESVARRSAE
ncbi:MAG: hypothetical protein PF636_06230 [Actinomycetota bacterium]|jgi:DNA-binding Lrp family transcriptional regulator|nr:hypothetical protein [Actinomycetota bacterium]